MNWLYKMHDKLKIANKPQISPFLTLHRNWHAVVRAMLHGDSDKNGHYQ